LGVESSLLSFPSQSPTAEEVAAMREETELRNAEYAAREAERRDDEDAGASD
jgi:hypothetical protein